MSERTSNSDAGLIKQELTLNASKPGPFTRPVLLSLFFSCLISIYSVLAAIHCINAVKCISPVRLTGMCVFHETAGGAVHLQQPQLSTVNCHWFSSEVDAHHQQNLTIGGPLKWNKFRENRKEGAAEELRDGKLQIELWQLKTKVNL